MLFMLVLMIISHLLIDVIFLDGRDCVEKGNPNSRIGGPDACEVIPHSKPWIAWIEHCGGTLIGSKYVLTAAHCVCKDYYDCNEFIVDYAVLGDHEINVVDDGEMKITIAGIIVHPDYKSKPLYLENEFDCNIVVERF